MEVTRQDLETIVYGARNDGEGVKFPGLKYVRVEPGRLVATDGHVLIVRELAGEPDDKFEPFCISVADVRGAIKANAELWKSNGNTVKLDPGDDFMAKIGRKRVAKQETTYPDWPKVLIKKDKRGCQVARFDPAKMMKVLQGLKDVSIVELRIWCPDEAARLDGVTEDGRKVMALVMPTVVDK